MNKPVISILEKANIVDQSQNSIVVTDCNGSIIYVNTHFQEITGYTSDEVIGKNPRILQSGKTSLETYKDMWAVITSGGRWKGELCNKKKNGALFWELANIFGLVDENGEIYRYVAIKNDITRRKKAELENEELFSMLDKMGEIAKVGIWKLDLKKTPPTQTWTHGIYRIAEIDLQEIDYQLPQGYHFYTDPSKEKIKMALQKIIKNGGSYDLALEIKTGKGNLAWVQATGVAERVGDETVSISGVIQDITVRKKLEDALRKRGDTDSLTGLWNRTHFNEQIEIEIDRVARHEKPLTVIFLDIDHFKIINDNLGHAFGDKVLIRLAEVMKKVLRPTDFAHRIGGEEFVIMLPSIGVKSGSLVAEKLRKMFSKEPFKTDSGEIIKVTLSLGVAEYVPGWSAESFIKLADKKMYEAKENGRNRVSS